MPVETGIQPGLAMDSRVRGNDIQERTPSSDATTRRWQAQPRARAFAQPAWRLNALKKLPPAWHLNALRNSRCLLFALSLKTELL